MEAGPKRLHCPGAKQVGGFSFPLASERALVGALYLGRDRPVDVFLPASMTLLLLSLLKHPLRLDSHSHLPFPNASLSCHCRHVPAQLGQERPRLLGAPGLGSINEHGAGQHSDAAVTGWGVRKATPLHWLTSRAPASRSAW